MTFIINHFAWVIIAKKQFKEKTVFIWHPWNVTHCCLLCQYYIRYTVSPEQRLDLIKKCVRKKVQFGKTKLQKQQTHNLVILYNFKNRGKIRELNSVLYRAGLCLALPLFWRLTHKSWKLPPNRYLKWPPIWSLFEVAVSRDFLSFFLLKRFYLGPIWTDTNGFANFFVFCKVLVSEELTFFEKLAH